MNHIRLLFALLPLLVGCTSGPWLGTIQQQQQEAVVHDPYADPVIAPKVVGGRPREYQKDFAEVQRSQLLQQVVTPTAPRYHSP